MWKWKRNGAKTDTHPTVTSKMLLPTELETAMSPNPLRATITEVIKSGIEVPAAKNVRPITWWRGEEKCFNLQKSDKTPPYDTHFGRNFGSLPGHVRPPDHEIRVGCNPGNRTEKGDSIELLAAWRFRIWQREPQREQDGGHQQIGDTLLARARPGHVQGFGLILNIVVALQCFI